MIRQWYETLKREILALEDRVRELARIIAEIQSGTSGATSLTFKTIAVSGQSNVVADSSTDTLTIAAGSGITLTTNAGTDTVTIAATGSAGGGGFSLVEQHTASTSATLDFTTWYSSTYDSYYIDIIDLIPHTNAVSLRMRMSVDGGSTYDNAANYEYASYAWAASASSNQGGTGQTEILINSAADIPANSTWGFTASLWLRSPGSVSLYKPVYGQASYFSTGVEIKGVQTSGGYRSSSVVNAFRFYMSSGNFSGTIRVYGIAKT